MKTIKLGILKRVKIYDSIKELPITRYNELQKMAMVDLGVGSRVEDFNNHFSKLHAYINHDKKDEAINELRNVFKNFYLMIDRVGTWSYSILPFIHSINGKEYELKESNYRDDIKMLSDKGLKVEHCQDLIDELKKKIADELESYFPRRYNTVSNANALTDLKRQSLKILELIRADYEGREEDKEKAQKVIDNIDDYLISLNPVKDFSNSSDNSINQIEKSFEFLCTSMEEVGIKNPKALSTFEFNSKIEYFQSKKKNQG